MKAMKLIGTVLRCSARKVNSSSKETYVTNLLVLDPENSGGTTYAAARVSAAGASAPAGFGGCAAMIARKAGTPPVLFTMLMTVNAISDMGLTWWGLSSQHY